MTAIKMHDQLSPALSLSLSPIHLEQHHLSFAPDPLPVPLTCPHPLVSSPQFPVLNSCPQPSISLLIFLLLCPQLSLVATCQGNQLLARGNLLGLLQRTMDQQGALLVAQRAEVQERVRINIRSSSRHKK